ncbi:tRNA guanosine(34) transglycosylase Tgt [Rickettsia typhi]|uniref:Queuine tRNA-ribosyltransferase n=2 Tax=Rickettsia typhi TaxID=785 RepID=TGT_RICTY|nr:tRNA guanosine(34) transglycosylase Tgt [Rickettsia typhi]Q68W26.1 RecName: Full=Queuine tRNA-ribosyltransferase; AltName: Full=Guanine insertion enzyme; AltName: Full=tRNA-guanine transglycosylase [Rickettsia typhi str. Wilmington]AAU04166.1 Guanine insertion enzyme [Rickettsia typhi str. Wilmington]AFE54544.1 queuine tRNA-ribosyltransferase [Rickettsia typhi str. TH1527]AFE55383.1 queuine tRNA-ribosyltransferase [Rickettsia typhi str. B9991CWPP]
MSKFSFTIHSNYKKARSGVITTAHGKIRTPTFMPVGTRGTVKAMLTESVVETGADILLGNTYHLMLQPSAERIAYLGGLHKFMNWDKPILTDSGGFQVMSLSKLRKITEEGVSFRSHINGNKYMLTPEYSTEIQYLLGSTITMALDECTPYPSTFEEAKTSMNLTTRWANRSRDAFVKREGYAQFGIIQGSVYKELREQSVKDLVKFDFDGYAIGGLAVGEGQELMFKVLDYVSDFLPQNKPRYLMGVGKPADIIGAVSRGIDMFDCVIPTRSGRNGQAFTKYGTVNIRNSKYAEDKAPLEYDCKCPACTNYTKAYLHHLVRIREILGPMLMTWHNLTYFQNLMSRIRAYIKLGKDFDFVN